jgi:hypothetical protein
VSGSGSSALASVTVQKWRGLTRPTL